MKDSKCFARNVCLTQSGLQPVVSPEGVRTWTCADQKCKYANIPCRYAENHSGFPAVPVCFVGNTGHGKTAYLAASFKQFDTISNFNIWPNFFTESLDDVAYGDFRLRLAQYESGSLEASDLGLLPPAIVRCHNIPRVGGCQLIFLDNGGEAFDDNSLRTTQHASHLANTATVVWLASLVDGTKQGALTPTQELLRTLNIYKTAIANLGSNTKNQTVVLTLTKGERLVGLKGFPASAKAILQDDLTDRAADP